MQQKRLTPIARGLRRNQTDVEAKLWARLRNRQLENAKFRRQYPIDRYVADFCCPEARLVVELDGGQHAGRAADVERGAALEDAGYMIVRFWNTEVTENMPGVLETIRSALLAARGAPHPHPLPRGEGQ